MEIIMKELFSIKKCVKDIKNSDFVRQSSIPLEYVAGTPLFRICNSQLYLVVPFLRYKVTGKEDKTYVYPIKYTVTLSIPDKKIVSFEDLSSNRIFRKVDFNKPIGLFRHESIKRYTQKQFIKEKDKLFAAYDRIIAELIENKRYLKADGEEFKTLLNILLEPSLKPIYKALDKDFAEKFLTE